MLPKLVGKNMVFCGHVQGCSTQPEYMLPKLVGKNLFSIGNYGFRGAMEFNYYP